MRALACPASLKGVLSAREAAAALAEGFLRAGVDAQERPVADGGEGTADVVAAALGGERWPVRVSDPVGRPVEASWLELPDGHAVVEAAAAIGVALGVGDPLRASSRGLGELILAAGERPLVVCLGGVATVDGGAGLREVVDRLPPGSIALCDVRTRLGDAARLFGPQKGATPVAVAELERRLSGIAELAPYAELPGSGAAGGLGAALAALGAELVPGAETVLRLVGFGARLADADLVVTGEGTVDATTAEGKAPAAVAAACRETGSRCVVFGGRVEEPLPGVETVALSGDPARARADLVELGARLGTS